jgi:chorismate mutase
MRLAEWRTELDVIDAEVIFLLNRRAQLAMELLRILGTETLTLGDQEDDADRLLIMLYCGAKLMTDPLDERAVREIFRRINIESRRLAQQTGS